MKCAKCGKQVPDTAKVCSYCGTPIKKKSAAVKPRPPVKAPAKTSSSSMVNLVDEIRNMPLWTWIVGTAAVVAVIIILLTSGG